MLILSRTKGQQIMISDDIIISVIDVVGEQVRIGIEAPKHISIYREEIYKNIQDQNKRAVQLNDNIESILQDFSLPKKNKKN